MNRRLSPRQITRTATAFAALAFMAPAAFAGGLPVGTEIHSADQFIADLKACLVAAGDFSRPAAYHMVQLTDGTTYAIRPIEPDFTTAIAVLQKTITDNTASCPDQVRMTR